MGDRQPDDGLERLLGDAFDAQARASVGDHAAPPPPRFASGEAGNATVVRLSPGRRRFARLAAPLAAAAAVVGVVGAVLAISQSSDGDGHGNRAAGSPGASATVAHPTSGPTAVHVKLLNDDGATYGVGMPVIAYFNTSITDARALQRATVATVNSRPVAGGWYFERSEAGKGPIEGHFRPQTYWPANAAVHIAMPIKGLSAGDGMVFDNSLTTDFRTGDKHVATVSGNTHLLSLQVDDRHVGTYPVSLGAKDHATRPGTKIIMEKERTVTLSKPQSDHTKLDYAQRLTYGGEFLCAAPWNVKNISGHVDSTAGSTNLLPTDAKALFSVLRIGDVVDYTDTAGTQMAIGSGYGDWNVPWKVWLTGGLVPTV